MVSRSWSLRKSVICQFWMRHEVAFATFTAFTTFNDILLPFFAFFYFFYFLIRCSKSTFRQNLGYFGTLALLGLFCLLNLVQACTRLSKHKKVLCRFTDVVRVSFPSELLVLIHNFFSKFLAHAITCTLVYYTRRHISHKCAGIEQLLESLSSFPFSTSSSLLLS